MALIHKATLRPTKLELLADWLPGRDWYARSVGEMQRVASFRFDDPAGASESKRCWSGSETGRFTRCR